ncbi:hypothetical protein [Asticcacaulis sp. AND118]|uniref:hypothetical protein n=1 Tax=Asticcacaulis sp. AND118 TaxID=2840468 RepID=UPI001CFF68D0|nr:hypothetical protein [Asticcacaulis sp. AND118]UDF05222.1 hypothetical protein LH365_17685 [Asticcacaulis sp. AND118]
MLIAALARAFVKPEMLTIEPSERFISALEAHRIAFARLEALSNRDDFTAQKTPNGEWGTAYDRYLAATVELFSIGAYHDLDNEDLKGMYQAYEKQHMGTNVSPAFEALNVMPEEWRLILLEHYRPEAAA